MEFLAQSRKAIVPIVVTAVLALIAKFGVGSQTSFGDGITALVTAILVWVTPNKS